MAEWYDNVFGRPEASPVRVVSPDESPNINFTLRIGATISGRVVDSQTWLTISSMGVTARINQREISQTRTGLDGAYKLQGVPDGDIEVTVSGQGYVEQHRNLTVRDGTDITGVDF